jgi:hypothetical protein
LIEQSAVKGVAVELIFIKPHPFTSPASQAYLSHRYKPPLAMVSCGLQSEGKARLPFLGKFHADEGPLTIMCKPFTHQRVSASVA